MSYFIGVAIAITVLITLVFLGKILVVVLAKKIRCFACEQGDK